MTTRTVKIFGQGFGSTPAEISVTLNENVIYTGEIPTIDQPVYTLPNLEVANTVPQLCDFEIGMDVSGTIPMTCTVLSGTVIFAQILANYCVLDNTDPVIGSGPDVFNNIDGIGDARSNVYINEIAQAINHTEELSGTWWFTVPAGSVFRYDLDVQAGTANVAPTPPAP
jgi:hypothetical protein